MNKSVFNKVVLYFLSIFSCCREMVELFERSKMVAFFHANPLKKNKFRIAWQVKTVLIVLINERYC